MGFLEQENAGFNFPLPKVTEEGHRKPPVDWVT